MSTSKNRELSSWKVLEDYLRGLVYMHHGQNMSARDSATIAVAFLLQGMMLEDLLASGTPDRHSRIIRWCKTICSVDILDLSRFLKETTVFFRNIPEGSVYSYDDFKHHLGIDYPFVGEYFSPIKEEVESFLASPNAASFRVINQHLCFLARVSLQDIDFSLSCMSDYLHIETMLANHRFDPIILDSLNKIIRGWFATFHDSGFYPRHGNGGVAILGKCGTNEKYSSFGSDPMLQYFLKNQDGDCHSWFPRPASTLDRCCQVEFVPKSIQTWRTISMEPAVLQFFQQGVARQLDDFLSTHPVLKNHIHLHDQSYNRERSRTASKDRQFATIDLSNASDCVSWELVKVMFRGTPVLRGFYATRSRSALLPDKSRLGLKKFAPMGSALCFPVETIVFAAICEHVARLQSCTGTPSRYLVYGDDIVIESHLALDLIETLGALGFTASPTKSFSSLQLPFRESCGGEYFDGVDVSPFRLSRKFSAEKLSRWNPSVFDGYIKSANLSSGFGFKLVRSWFISQLLMLPQELRPRFSEDDTQLYSPQPTNFHLQRKWKKDWQCEVLRHGSNTVRPKDSPLCDEDLRLFEWLRSTACRTRSIIWPGDSVAVNGTRSTARLGSGWISNS